jgi:SAM-dependent methyltransferase
MISKGNSLDALRCGAVGDARGRVLEFGAGPGTNFKCWKRSERITEWVGVDPNEKFKPLLEASKVEHEIAFPTSTVWLQGEDVDVEPHSFDYIIGTHVLCSVTNKTQVLQQMVRALRPGGKIIFFEHTLAPTGNGDGEFTSTDGARVRWWQELIAPIFFVLGRGCTFSEIWVDLETLQDHYGMDLDLRHVKAPHNLPIFQPHVVGSARMPFTELEPESEPESESESETRAEQEQEQEQEREHRTDRDEKST